MASASNPSGPESSRGARVSVRAPGGGKIKKLLSMSGTFLTVAVLTGLLWVWADQSQLVDQEIKLSFVLAAQSESGLILLSVDDGSREAFPDTAGGGIDIEATVEFKGTRSRLQELRADPLVEPDSAVLVNDQVVGRYIDPDFLGDLISDQRELTARTGIDSELNNRRK